MLKLNVNKSYNLQNKDPDKYNDELGMAHTLLWTSRSKLGVLKLCRYNKMATTINGIEFILTPDTITNSFRNNKIVCGFDEDAQNLIDKYEKIGYTIGSSIVFPIMIDGKSIGWTMNRARGLNSKIHDRFDYTLECIKRYYDKNINNPLIRAIEKSANFFEIFGSFKEYVDFFFLNDLVDENYNVISFTDTIDFNCAIPITKGSYIKYLSNTMEFVKKRNKRINSWIEKSDQKYI